MIKREELRELAAFRADQKLGAVALSFYFQPQPPSDRSHHNEAIRAKDLVKQALKKANGNAGNGSLHADLDRVLEIANRLPGHGRGRAIFACSAENLWKEYELPPNLGTTNIYIQHRLQLKPLAMMLGAQPDLCVAVVDRQRARFFDLSPNALHERESMVHLLSRNANNYGFHGYEAGHAERRSADEALHHLKAVAERLRIDLEKGVWQQLIVGCNAVNWAQFEPLLHRYVKQRLIGRFSSDVASITENDVRKQALALYQKWSHERVRARADEALSFAKANGRGVTGLRRVLRSLETGEVQAIFLAENYSARAVECLNCGHIDAHIVSSCISCGRATRELDDVCDALIPAAIRRDVELFYLKDHAGLDRAGNIAALLRFRAAKFKPGEMAAAS